MGRSSLDTYSGCCIYKLSSIILFHDICVEKKINLSKFVAQIVSNLSFRVVWIWFEILWAFNFEPSPPSLPSSQIFVPRTITNRIDLYPFCGIWIKWTKKQFSHEFYTMISLFTLVTPGCWIVPGFLQVRILLRLASRVGGVGERFGREAWICFFPILFFSRLWLINWIVGS